jgi:flagellar basal-body rod protein FlgB
MTGAETRTTGLLERYLDLAAFRQGLVAGNIANIDTPGYRTRDIDFGVELQRAITTSAPAAPNVKQVAGLIERPDGNNVSVDRESLLLAQTQLQFRVGVQLLRGEFRRVLTAINEGRQG